MKTRIVNWFNIHKLKIALVVIFFFLGFFAGVGFNYLKNFSIQFDDKINPVALFSIFVTVILVWFVSNILDKEKTTEKTSKEIIGKKVQDLYIFVDEFSTKVVMSDFKYTDATSSLKTISMSIKTIKNLIEIAKLTKPIGLTDLEGNSNKLWDLLTNTPVIDEANGDIPSYRVKDNICIFSSDRALEINNAFNDLKDKIMVLEIQINII